MKTSPLWERGPEPEQVAWTGLEAERSLWATRAPQPLSGARPGPPLTRQLKCGPSSLEGERCRGMSGRHGPPESEWLGAGGGKGAAAVTTTSHLLRFSV